MGKKKLANLIGQVRILTKTNERKKIEALLKIDKLYERQLDADLILEIIGRALEVYDVTD